MQMQEKRMKNKSWMFFLWTILLIAADQLTKWLAQVFLRGKGAVPVLRGVLDLLYLENIGAAFGILKHRQILLALLAVLISIAAFWFYRRLPSVREFIWLRICCVMLCAGALGNMIDRLFHGFVIDFIYVSLIDFPVFNLADIYVCVSCALLLILLIFVYKEEDLQGLRKKK